MVVCPRHPETVREPERASRVRTDVWERFEGDLKIAHAERSVVGNGSVA